MCQKERRPSGRRCHGQHVSNLPSPMRERARSVGFLGASTIAGFVVHPRGKYLETAADRSAIISITSYMLLIGKKCALQRAVVFTFVGSRT